MAVIANTDEPVLAGSVEEIETNNPVTRKMIVNDLGQEWVLEFHYAEGYYTVNDEVYLMTSEEITNATYASINYSTGRNNTVNLPWKGSVQLLAAAITGAVSGSANVASWASTIASAITADAGTIVCTYTQYDSNEQYYSSYYGIYYHKCINTNIKFYYNSRLAAGPYTGGWFDPIRPY